MKPPSPAAVPPDAETGIGLLGRKMEHHFGFLLPDEKKTGMWRAVLDAASEQHILPLECLRHLVDAPRGDEMLENLALRLTVGETFFFRERKFLDAFIDAVLPDIAARKRDDIRLWSAGCSTGEEAYTLSMLADDALANGPLAGRTLRGFSVLGTDINSRAIEKARDGVYSRWSFRGMDESVIRRYFSPCGNERYSVKEMYRKHVSFTRLNLADRQWPLWRDGAGPDAIFCRNVLIYFSREKREEILARFHRLLPDGGWLIVASCETSPFLSSRFASVTRDGATLYRKDGAASPAFSVQRPDLHDLPAPHEGIRSECGSPVSRTDGVPEEAETPPPADEGAVDAFSMSPRGSRNLLENAREFADRGMHEAALREARDAHGRDRTDPVPLYFMSLLLQELGNENDAFSALRSALFLEPEFIMAHYAMGILALGRGKTGEADRHLRNAEDLLSRNPPDSVVPEGEGVTAGELLAAVRTLRRDALR